MNKPFVIRDSVEVPMRDGITLRADIWLPDADGSWPVLLQRTPYGKEDPFIAQHIAQLDYRAALRRGYAVVVQDTRGRGASGGEFVPFACEERDGVDTVAWLREQPFCDGSVAMFGPSYVGATQVLAAAGRPEGLRAIAPLISTGRHEATWKYRGGAIELGFLLLWALEPLISADLPRRLPGMPPEDARRAGAAYARLLADPMAAFAELPFRNQDLELLAPYTSQWFDNVRAESADTDRHTLDALEAGDTRALVMCGWNDLFLEGSIELFRAVRSRHEDRSDVADRLLVGPWSHANLTDWQGDVWHGYGAFAALSEEQLGFFADAFEDRPPSSPMVRYFRTGSNTWHAAPDWPLPGTDMRELHLTDQVATWAPDESGDWSRSWASDTLDPVPTTGGATFLPGLLHGRNSGPRNQHGVEGRDDVVVFTSAPLQDDLEVTGLVEARLWVSSSAPTCDWTVRLCEVDTDDRSMGLVDGILRWTRCRDGRPGEPTEVAVRVGHMGHLFRRGVRIRVQIASSNFPRFDRNPQSGTPSTTAEARDFLVAQQAVHGGPERRSRIILPVVATAFPVLASPGDYRRAAPDGDAAA